MQEDEKRKITIMYEACDGFTKQATFTDLGDARTYAQHWVGHNADDGGHYAVSEDGVSRIMVEGATLSELFEVKS